MTTPPAASPAPSYSNQAANWYLNLGHDDLPGDIVARVKLHVLDILGLALAGAARDSGRSVRAAMLGLGKSDECHILGFGDATSALLAAIANGTMAHAMEFDDTHNESIAHIANSVTTTALDCPGRTAGPGAASEALVAIAGGNEIACRLGVVAPGALHKVGYHATGVIGTISATCVAGRLLESSTCARCSNATRHRRQPGRRHHGMLVRRHLVEVFAPRTGRAQRHHRRQSRQGRL